MKHLFLDTNVLLDVLTNREPFADAASRLMDYADRGKLNLYISALSYTNIHYILRKSYNDKQIVSLLKDIHAIVKTVDVTSQVIGQAIDSGIKDFEDAVQLYTALSQTKVQSIVTRDPKGFRRSSLPVFTPEEALVTIGGPGI